MKYRMLAFDMDGTIVGNGHVIHQRIIDVFYRLLQEGYWITLCSGRGFYHLTRFIHELHLDMYQGYLVEGNGIAISDTLTKKRKRIGKYLDSQYNKKLYEYVIGNNFGMYINANDIRYEHLYHHSDCDTQVIEINQDVIDSLDHIDKSGVFIQDGARLLTVYNELINLFKNQCEVVISGPNSVELVDFSVSKGNGLKQLCKDLNISNNQVIVFGDGQNDISMFKAFKNSVCMGSAFDFVKKEATFIASDWESDGVIDGLKYYGVIK